MVVFHDEKHVAQDCRVQLEAKLVKTVGQYSQNILQQQQVKRTVEASGDLGVFLDVQ